MSKVWLLFLCCAAGGLSIVLLPAETSAAWSHLSWQNNYLCAATGQELQPSVVYDYAGGAFVVWRDGRMGGTDLFAQHIRSDGSLAWPGDVPISTGSGAPTGFRVLSVNSGGCYVVWAEDRGGGTGSDIYAQYLRSDGSKAWASNGAVVCDAPGAQITPAATIARVSTPRLTYNLVVVWSDQRTDAGDIYAQRLDSGGARTWTSSGVALATRTGNQDDPEVTYDGIGGVIATWTGVPSGATTPRVRAQRVNSAGVPQWASDGVVLTTLVFPQSNPSICPDGADGAVVAAQGAPVATSDIFAQRVNSNGTLAWGDGTVICGEATAGQFDVTVHASGTGSYYYVWRDMRGGLTRVYAQKTNASGAVQWSANGVSPTSSSREQLSAWSTYYSNSLFIGWQEYGGNISDIYVQKLSTAAVLMWGANGVAASTALGGQAVPSVVPDGAGGAIAVWEDRRVGAFSDLFCQRVETSGYLGSPEPDILEVRDVPADQGGHVRVTWAASYLDADPGYRMAWYDVYRRVPAGPSFDPIVTLPASGLATYSYVAPTTVDSSGGSNLRTSFMIRVRNADGSLQWLSAPDSGYSVDNLSPPAPGAFTAEWGAGRAELRWLASEAPDLAGYRLERCADPGFAPEMVSLAAETEATQAVDDAPAAWYRLMAVDRNGNQSPPFVAALAGAPAGALDSAPVELSLAASYPNPARGGMQVRFALPRAAPIRLLAYDASGRLVRTLASGVVAAGRHVAHWDGRDDQGRTVPSAFYVIRLECDGRALTRKAVWVH
jgi:hypothetical protein